MTQEERELLLKDLCARLPYGVVVQIINKHPVILGDGNESDESDEPYNVSLTIGDHDSLVDFFNGDWVTGIKPYLRPMSSISEKEKQERYKFSAFNNIEVFDWYNTHHFDYRGLIGKGLALEAPENLYR